MEIESRRSHSLRQYLSRISAWIESTAIVSDGRSSSSYAICMNWLVRSLPCLNRMTWSRVFFLASRGTNSKHALVGSKVQKVYGGQVGNPPTTAPMLCFAASVFLNLFAALGMHTRLRVRVARSALPRMAKPVRARWAKRQTPREVSLPFFS